MKTPELLKRRAVKDFAQLDVCHQLLTVSQWLAYMDTTMRTGIRTPEDALKLYRAWLGNKILLTDSGEPVGAANRVSVLGYDPMTKH